jgi:pyroglutamyl-peptidase
MHFRDSVTTKVLLLGFGPFMGFTSNPSGDIAKTLNGKTIGDAVVSGKVLTVAHKESAMEAHEYIVGEKPDVIIVTALATSKGCIALEKLAINKYYFRAQDEETEEALYDDGKDAYFSTLPLEGIKHKLQDKSIPSEYSFSAHAHISNEVFYEAMRCAEKFGIPKAGLISLPLSHQQVANEMQNTYYRSILSTPSMAQETLNAAMELIIEASARLSP